MCGLFVSGGHMDNGYMVHSIHFLIMEESEVVDFHGNHLNGKPHPSSEHRASLYTSHQFTQLNSALCTPSNLSLHSSLVTWEVSAMVATSFLIA